MNGDSCAGWDWAGGSCPRGESDRETIAYPQLPHSGGITYQDGLFPFLEVERRKAVAKGLANV